MTIKKIKDSSGQEHGIDYEALENLPAIAGEPIYVKSVELTPGLTSISTKQNVELDVSSYLPDDNETYMVTIIAWGYTEEKSKIATIQIISDVDDILYGDWVRSYSDGRADFTCTLDILVGPARKIVIKGHSSPSYSCSFQVWTRRYQKVNAIKVEG